MVFLFLIFSCFCVAEYTPDYKELERAEWSLYEEFFEKPNEKPKSFWDKLWKKIFPLSPKERLIKRFLKEPVGTTKEKRPNELIVSFTSFPARIERVFLVVESLFRQTVKPNRIILYLSLEEFPDKKIPETLKAQMERGLEIHWVKENFRPYNKLVHALKEYPEAVIITVDDDQYYDPNLIYSLYTTHLKYPKDRVSQRIKILMVNKEREVLPSLHWKSLSTSNPSAFKKPSIFFYSSGVRGILYPPYCLHSDVFNSKKFQKLSPNHDDLWFWTMGVIKGTKTRWTGVTLETKSFTIGPKLVTENSRRIGNYYKKNDMLLSDVKLHNVLSYYSLYKKFNIKLNPRILELSKEWTSEKIISFGKEKRTQQILAASKKSS